MIFVSCVTLSFLIFDTNIRGASVGLAITQSMTLTSMLQWGIRQSAEVMNQMMAVQGADSRLNSLTCFLVEKVENRWILAIHTFPEDPQA